MSATFTSLVLANYKVGQFVQEKINCMTMTHNLLYSYLCNLLAAVINVHVKYNTLSFTTTTLGYQKSEAQMTHTTVILASLVSCSHSLYV